MRTFLRRGSIRMWIYAASFLLLWLWLLGLQLKSPNFLFAAAQTAGVAFLVYWIRRAGLKLLPGIVVSAITGWLLSFLVSVFFEWIFDPRFFISMKEQLQAGTIVTQMYAWFIVSLMYLGIIQVPTIFVLEYSDTHHVEAGLVKGRR